MHRQPQIVPRWLTLKGASIHTGLSERTIENYIRANLVISSNVVMPGATVSVVHSTVWYLWRAGA